MNRKRTRERAASILLLTGFIAGCAASSIGEGPNPAVRFDRPETNIRLDNVGILDDSIANKLEVQRSGSRRVGNGLAEVFVALRNRTDYALQIECRVQFLDGEGVGIEGPTPWKRLIFPPNGMTTWTERSTRSDVRHYYVEVREGS